MVSIGNNSFSLDRIVDHDRFSPDRFSPRAIGEKSLPLRAGDKNDPVSDEYIKIVIDDKTKPFKNFNDGFNFEMDIRVHGKQNFFSQDLQHAGNQDVGKIERAEMDDVGGPKHVQKLFQMFR